MLKRRGFTLAEVLIALLLVGILSSISIQTLRNRDNSAEYEALRNKAVTNIQGVMHESLYSTMSSEIFDKNFQQLWDRVDKHLSTDTGSIKSKDGAINITTSQVMRDGVNYAYTQKDGNSHVAEITIDVNGSKAPNEEGKDIFKYNMDKFGGILLATIPDEPDKEYCPDGVTVKNSDGSNCPKCTDGSMVTTPDRSNCPKCPNGTTERNADGSNCDKCANGEMANANRSNCPKCGIQTIEANATRSNCPKCPDGTTEKIDIAGSNCPLPDCTLGRVRVNGECKCVAPTPYFYEGDGCHQCPLDEPYYWDDACHNKKVAYLFAELAYDYGNTYSSYYNGRIWLAKNKDGSGQITDFQAFSETTVCMTTSPGFYGSDCVILIGLDAGGYRTFTISKGNDNYHGLTPQNANSIVHIRDFNLRNGEDPQYEVKLGNSQSGLEIEL